MRNQKSNTLGFFVLLFVILDWVRCRLYIQRVQGWKDGVLTTLKAQIDSEKEKKA